jgi:hypothetical protein
MDMYKHDHRSVLIASHQSCLLLHFVTDVIHTQQHDNPMRSDCLEHHIRLELIVKSYAPISYADRLDGNVSLMLVVTNNSCKSINQYLEIVDSLEFVQQLHHIS